jgi:hypothetical protein
MSMSPRAEAWGRVVEAVRLLVMALTLYASLRPAAREIRSAAWGFVAGINVGFPAILMALN